MALTQLYVDPAIAADSGTGTIGDPYGDLEYCIEQSTFDTTNGTQVNIKAGTDEVLAANLSTALADVSVSIAWTPTSTAPLIFRGYTSVADDGGIGGISGGGLVSVYNDANLDYVFFIDLHCHNCGSANILDMDNWCGVIRCEIDNTTASGLRFDVGGVASNNHIHNIGADGINFNGAGGLASFNYLENGTNDFTEAIDLNIGSVAYRNIISVDGTSNGILAGDYSSCFHNSVYSNAGTGTGIGQLNGSEASVCTNNIVEGFSGVGGAGFDFSGTNQSIIIMGGNAAYNNTDNFVGHSNWKAFSLGNDEVLTASAFTSAATGDFAPVDTGSVKEGALPSAWTN